ncbi:MAG: hypothetical protein AB7O96_05260 [Pseudobdellovibrionaceae bacterium]
MFFVLFFFKSGIDLKYSGHWRKEYDPSDGDSNLIFIRFSTVVKAGRDVAMLL